MSVLKMMLSNVGLTLESGSVYISETLGRQISTNTLRTMMKSKTSVPVDVVNCLKERQDAINQASSDFTNWIEDPAREMTNNVVVVPHAHNKDDDIQKLGLAQAILRSPRSCSISQK